MPEICFDLSRSIDLHKLSTAKTNEEAIAGKTSGLIGPDEWVTWQAKHLGFKQKLTSKITSFQSPDYFVDEQIKGIFKSFHHKHSFEIAGEITLMTDVLTFSSPFGIAGLIFDSIFLKKYLTKFLLERNDIIKDFAESDRWKKVLRLK